MNRGERRRRNKVIYDRRSKLFYQVWHHPYIPCNEDEIDEWRHSSIYKNKRKAKTWKEFQEKDPHCIFIKILVLYGIMGIGLNSIEK